MQPRKILRSIFLAGALSSVLIGTQSFCADKSCVISGGMIAFDVTGEQQANPIKKLGQALHEGNRCSALRLMWSVSAVNTSTQATALYDRTRKTVSFFSRQEVSGLGNENLSPGITHRVFYGVKDWMILDIVKKHMGPTESSDDSFLSALSNYGCRRVVLLNPVFKSLSRKQ